MSQQEQNRRGTMNVDSEYDDWRTRYEAAIAEYEAMAEGRRERKLVKLAQANRNRALQVEDEIDQRYLETHPTYDPIAQYLRHREESGRMAWDLLCWSVRTAGNTVLASIAANLVRRFSTEAINHAEKLLWRTQKKLAPPADSRTAAERERRKICRRSTLSPQPTPDDIRQAWLKADSSVRGIIAFGAAIHDLECYVDNSLGFDEDGNIVGRATGILGWLQENIPELAVRYKTIMRYKSIAKRCRQFLMIKDPQPLDPDDPCLASLLAGCPATQKDIRERLDAVLSTRGPKITP